MKKLQLLYLGAVLSIFTLSNIQCPYDTADEYTTTFDDATEGDSSLDDNYDQNYLFSDDDDSAINTTDNNDQNNFAEEATPDVSDLQRINEIPLMGSEYDLDDFETEDSTESPTTEVIEPNTATQDLTSNTSDTDYSNFEAENAEDALLTDKNSDSTEYNPELNFNDDATEMSNAEDSTETPAFSTDTPDNNDTISNDSEEEIMSGSLATTSQPLPDTDEDGSYQGGDNLMGDDDFGNYDNDQDSPMDDGYADFDEQATNNDATTDYTF